MTFFFLEPFQGYMCGLNTHTNLFITINIEHNTVLGVVQPNTRRPDFRDFAAF